MWTQNFFPIKATQTYLVLWIGIIILGCDWPRHEPTSKAKFDSNTSEIIKPAITSSQFEKMEQTYQVESLLNKSFKIPAGKTRITATVTEVAEGYQVLLIEISEGRKIFHVTTVIQGSKKSAVISRDLKQTTGWKGRYLFVRSSCGGGNIYRCNVDHIFKRINNELHQLATVGVLAGKVETTDIIGPSFKNGIFLDVETSMETNDFTSHSNAPFIVLGLKDRGTRLSLDRERTWYLNREECIKNINAANDALSKNDLVYRRYTAEGLLHNLAVAKLTDRKQDYNQASILIARLIGEYNLQRYQNAVNFAIARPYNQNLAGH